MILQNDKILNNNALRDTYVITNYVLRYRRSQNIVMRCLETHFERQVVVAKLTEMR